MNSPTKARSRPTATASSCCDHPNRKDGDATNAGKRRPVPWLVGWSDFRRYLGRALDACDTGRVVFVVVPEHITPGTEAQRLVGIAPARCWAQAFAAAFADFEQGRFRRVRLESLPAKRNRGGSTTKTKCSPRRASRPRALKKGPGNR